MASMHKIRSIIGKLVKTNKLSIYSTHAIVEKEYALQRTRYIKSPLEMSGHPVVRLFGSSALNESLHIWKDELSHICFGASCEWVPDNVDTRTREFMHKWRTVAYGWVENNHDTLTKLDDMYDIYVTRILNKHVRGNILSVFSEMCSQFGKRWVQRTAGKDPSIVRIICELAALGRNKSWKLIRHAVWLTSQFTTQERTRYVDCASSKEYQQSHMALQLLEDKTFSLRTTVTNVRDELQTIIFDGVAQNTHIDRQILRLALKQYRCSWISRGADVACDNTGTVELVRRIPMILYWSIVHSVYLRNWHDVYIVNCCISYMTNHTHPYGNSDNMYMSWVGDGISPSIAIAQGWHPGLALMLSHGVSYASFSAQLDTAQCRQFLFMLNAVFNDKQSVIRFLDRGFLQVIKKWKLYMYMVHYHPTIATRATSLRHIPIPKDLETLVHTARASNNAIVREWVIRNWKHVGFYKPRKSYGPRNRVITYQYKDRLDEIRAEDLDVGVATSVDRSFRNSKARLLLEMQDPNTKDVTLPICPLGDTTAVIQLKTSEELRAESRSMHHCVGGYVDDCLTNGVFIYHVSGTDDETTAEIVQVGPETFSCLQHKGASDVAPSPEQEQLLRTFIATNNKRLQLQQRSVTRQIHM